MHLGRFHRTVDLLAADYRSINIEGNLASIIASLNQVAGNPTNADIALAFRQQLDAFKEALSKSPLNHPRPVLQMILDAIGASNFVGNQLYERVKRAISSNEGTTALALQQLGTLQTETLTFYRQVTSIAEAFAVLKVENDELGPGEGEIGLLLPKNDESSNLKAFGKELSQWHIALTAMAELFDPASAQIKIRTCSTTDWMIYLAATPPVLWGISKCLRGVNAILKDLELIRK